MIAFASVCLVQVLNQEKFTDEGKRQDIYSYLQRLVEVLNTSLMVDHPVHPLASILSSLEMALAAHPQTTLSDTYMEHETDFDFGAFINEGMNLGYLTGREEWPPIPDEVPHR